MYIAFVDLSVYLSFAPRMLLIAQYQRYFQHGFTVYFKAAYFQYTFSIQGNDQIQGFRISRQLQVIAGRVGVCTRMGMVDGEKIFSQLPHFSHGRDLLSGIQQKTLRWKCCGVFYRIAMDRQAVLTTDKPAYLDIGRDLRKMQQLVGKFSGDFDFCWGRHNECVRSVLRFLPISHAGLSR